MMESRKDRWHTATRISRGEKSPSRSNNGNIAVIDFGTTFCSLAFATVGNPDLVDTKSVDINTIRLNQYYKRVPTAILLKQCEPTCASSLTHLDLPVSRTCDYKVVSFGYEAMAQVQSLKSSQRSKYLYFERFKMILQQDEAVHRNKTTKSSDGRKFYLIEVIAYVLKHLKCQLECHLQNTDSPLKGIDFHWVITVPAIWKARGKRMMREAGYMAGLTSANPGITCFIEVGKGVLCPQETNPDKLTLALEPEAAAIYCQTMDKDAIASCCPVDGPLQSDQYVVVDIGGGTVDITVHHHDQEKGVKVVISPVGNDCGGTMVNREFAKFLQKIVEDSGFACFIDSGVRSERMAVLNKLLYSEFEGQKVCFGDNASGLPTEHEYAVKLPIQLTKLYGIEKIEAGVKALNDDRIHLEDDTLHITHSRFEHFFLPAIQGILECVNGVFEKLEKEVDTVYLVGGFGGCKYTYEKIASMMKAKFSQMPVRIIVPKDHKLAVAQGAVKYSLKPDIIHSRTIDATYGTCICPRFDANIHDAMYTIMDHVGTIRTRDVYLRYVEKDDQISSDIVVTAQLKPVYNWATSMKIRIYSSFEKGVKYITTPSGNSNPSIRKIGEITLEMPNPDNLPREKRLVELTMDFSRTEIQVRAQYLVTGEEIKVAVDFLTAIVSSDYSTLDSDYSTFVSSYLTR